MRKRIVMLAALAAVLATGLFGIPFGLGVAHSYFGDERSELSRLATGATVAASTADPTAHDPVELPHVEAGIMLGVYDAAGRRIGGRGPARADRAVRAALRGSPAAGSTSADIVVAVPIAGDERVTGVIRAASGKTAIYWRIARTWGLMLIVAALAIGVTALVARRQARRLAGPLEEMSANAERLSDGDFSVRTRASNIPEIDSVAASLNSAAVRLGTLLARERAFSADASHQLRTPLTGLRLTLEAMRESPQRPDDDRIATAIDAIDRLQTTIDDLITLARDTPVRGEPLDLKNLIDEIHDTWHASLAARGRPLRLHENADVPAGCASPAAVRQILNVLLDNAVRHGAGAVTISVRDAGDALAIDVSDEGRGITRPQSEIFRRRAAGASGHGIGLAMAQSLAEAEGGRLRMARRAPPTFTLLLPVIQSRA